MSDGWHKIVINSRERAISSDINRLQTFRGRDIAELLRTWLDVYRDDDDAIGTLNVPASLETPLRAEIFEGLMCKPQAGSTSVFVDPGILMAMSPDSGSEESSYKYISDAGTTTPGALVIAAGGGGSIRIDVLECQFNPTDLTVSDNRDVFDPSTGLFTATSVTKERQGRLSFRVRQGTAGSGYPGNASGWLPLMVASVPSASTNNDGVTFWDVRPLVSDRVFGPSGVTKIAGIDSADYQLQRVGASSAVLAGVARANLDGRRLGGRLRRGSPGIDADSVDLAAAANQDTGTISEPLTGNVYLYLATPNGLPRWARYTDGPSGRVPRSPKGIPIASYFVPTNFEGRPATAIALPASTGLGGTTTDAVCVGVFGADVASSNWAHAIAANKVQNYSNSIGELSSATVSGNNFDFSVTNTIWPPSSKAILAQLSFGFALATASSSQFFVEVLVYEGATATGPFRSVRGVLLPAFTNASGGSINYIYRDFLRIPLFNKWPAPTPASPRLVRMAVTPTGGYGTTVTLTGTATLDVYGVEL